MTDIIKPDTPQERYDRLNTKQIKLKLNKRTDKDILDHLDTLDNRQGYIKELIRKDIASISSK